jgi:hypothetical protein
MKAKERHQLKQNDFAETAGQVMTWLTENRDRAVMIGIAVVLVLAIGGGYMYWRRYTADQAGALFGMAMAESQAPVVPAPTVPGATQSPGTYPTEAARDQAALAAFQQVASSYPSTVSGIAARYHVGSTLLAMGRYQEAEAAFNEAAKTAGSSFYASMAQLGAAEAALAQGKNDDAIKILTDLSGQRDGVLPVDGVLMQLGRAQLKAGKKQDARAAFKRVVDEFPNSPYVASAQQELAGLPTS